MKIAIIGYGYVGKAMYEFFKTHYEVGVHDPYQVVPDSLDQEEVNQCDLAVICVPTPMGDDGKCDTSIVREVASWVKTPLVLLKSTVPPGTTMELSMEFDLNIVFSPEYCGESSYWTPYAFHTDIKETPFFIFGGPPRHCSEMINIFEPIVGPTKQYRITTSKAAELAKYMENTFYATKIMFCYEMDEICKAMGEEYNEVKSLWLLDPRINPMHTSVFARNTRPFSGKCLPKDLSALVERAREFGYEPSLLNEIQQSNDRIEKIRSERV